MIQDVIDILETKGWVQYKLECPEGHCLFGAIAAANPDGDSSEDIVKIRRALFKKYNTTDITSWNDTHGRRKHEVIALLQSASSP